MVAAEAKLVRTDLPATHRRPINEAVNLLYKRNVVGKDKKSKNARRAEFAQALKMSLDESFGPHWHVLVGERLGFACKKRNESMGVWKVEDSMVVIWQSPGIEAAEAAALADPSAASAEPSGDADGASAAPAAAAASAPRVLEPAELEEGSERSKVAAVLCEELTKRIGEEDTQVLAQELRRRLSADFGTIWHVAVGNDFVCEAAEDRRNHVLVTTGKIRVVCFQHEQFKGGRSIDFDKVINSLPYLALALVCFLFMTINTVCKDELPDPNSPFRAMLHRRLCGPNSEQNLSYYGGGALVIFFLGRRTYRTGKAAREKAAEKNDVSIKKVKAA